MRRFTVVLLFVLPFVLAAAATQQQQPLTEAPTGFDNQTNGAVDAGIFSTAENVFMEVEQPSPDGLGPVYNAQSCRECHQNVVTGGPSQVSELRAGHQDAKGNFVGATLTLRDGSTLGPRSLINQRAICADAQGYVPERENIRAARMSVSILGDGFVEAVPDDELKGIATKQAQATNGRIHGEWVEVPVLEGGTLAVGRFGWKDQHASLLSFSGDAYVNEMGITNRLFSSETTTLCNPAGIAEPNDQNGDIDNFATFMRATKAPPRDAALAGSPDAIAGATIFNRIGCANCHVATLTTAPPGTTINGSTYTISDAIGNRAFHPYGDFLLHDIGTGDGIVQTGGQETAQKIRTVPLWGTRIRPEKMHDGASLTFEDAITRHRGEAAETSEQFRYLTPQHRQQFLTFLRSL
jgi:CxxC motif-containing protein (DUF1111 family)